MKISLWKFHSYITVILLIANSPLMWKCFVPIPNFIYKSLLVIWCLIGAFGITKIRVSSGYTKAALFIFLYLSLYIIGSKYDTGGSILNLLITSFALFSYSYSILYRGHFFDLANAFINIICIISAISVFFWFFGSVLNILPIYDITYYSWGNGILQTKTYLYLYFENLVQNQVLLGSSFARNCGIFPEVPIFSGYLLYAIGAEWFGKKETNNKKMMLLIVTLLSTQSTKAIIAFIIVFIVKFMIDNKNVKTLGVRVAKGIMSFILVVIGALVIYAVLLDKMGTASFIVRMDDFNAAIKTWRSNMIFGTGYENDLSIIENTTTPWLRNNNGLSMGVTVLLAEGGIILTTYYVLSFIAAYKSEIIKGKKQDFLLFSLILFLDLLVSNNTFSMTVLLFINIGYALFALNKTEIKHKKFARMRADIM